MIIIIGLKWFILYFVIFKVVIKYLLLLLMILIYFVYIEIDIERWRLVDDRMYGKGGIYYESLYVE